MLSGRSLEQGSMTRCLHHRRLESHCVHCAGLLESFKKDLEILEGIFKELEDYLETKRMAFPRFYFLSNNELLEALAQTKTVETVQQQVAKSFEGIARLNMTDDTKNIDINGVISHQGEEVSLRKPLRVSKFSVLSPLQMLVTLF